MTKGLRSSWASSGMPTEGRGTREDPLLSDRSWTVLQFRLIVYEGTGHLVLWEQSGKGAADLKAFVADPPKQPR